MRICDCAAPGLSIRKTRRDAICGASGRRAGGGAAHFHGLSLRQQCAERAECGQFVDERGDFFGCDEETATIRRAYPDAAALLDRS